MDFQQLEQRFRDCIHHSKNNYTPWLQRNLSALDQIRSSFHSINHDGREKVENLTERLKILDAEQKAYEDKQEERSSLQDSISLENNRTQAVQMRVTELSDVHQRQEQIIAAQLAEIEHALSEITVKNGSMLEAIMWYEKNLGFRVERTKNNALRFIFTKLVPTDLNQEFSFSIRHDKKINLYTLLECNPDVAGCGELVNELNCTNDLQKFIMKMRSKFQAEWKK